MADDQITTKPFVSQAQQRFAFATRQPWAKRWAKETNFAALPKRVRRKARTKSYTLDEFTAIALKEESAPFLVAAIATHTPELAALKGTKLAPGVTRLHGDLCNVHGRYGSCRAAGYGGAAPTSKRVPPKALPAAPKPKAGKRAAGGKKGSVARAAAKPKLTPEQRTAQHQEEQAKQREVNRQSVIDEMAAGDVGLQPASAKALLGFADGKEDPAYTDGLISAGLMERGQDGTPRLTSAGHAAVNAINHGNTRAALDAIGRGADRKAGQDERAAASTERKRVADERHAAVEAKRAEAERLRAERLAKQKKGGGGGKGKKPAPSAQPRPPALRTSTPPRVVRGGGGSGKAPQQPPKPKVPALPQALVDAAQALSEGREMDDATVNLLIRNGLAKRNRDGELILTGAGQRATKKEQAVTKAANPDNYLVVEDRAKPSTYHLQVKRSGKPDHGLMGAAWAALHGGYRGNTYAGPQKTEALTRLKRLYASEGMEIPKEKAARSAISRTTIKSTAGRILDAQPGHAAYSSPPTRATISQSLPLAKSAPHAGQSSRETSTVRISMLSILPPSFAVFKDASGAYRWIARTTTAFEDRDEEVISTKALEADVIRADTDHRYGPLRWWHVGRPDPLSASAPWGPGIDLGWCDFNAVSGRTLIESGTFKSEAIARGVAAHATELELSPGFFHAIGEPDASGVFHHIRRFERSLVPKWAGRASNPYTGLVVEKTMDPRKIEALKTLGVPEAAVKELIADVERTEKSAEADGVRYKEESPIKDFFSRLLRGEQVVTKEEAAEEAPAAVAAAPEPPPAVPAAFVPGTDALATLKEELAGLRAEIASLKAPMMDTEDDPALGGDSGADEAAEGEPPMDEGDSGGLTLSSDDLAAIGQMFGGVLSSALEPLVGALGITQKLDGHMSELKTLMGGYVKQKEAGDTQRTDQVAALKATIDQQQSAITESQSKLAELLGDQPRGTGYRPSQAADNGAEQLLAAIKDGPDGALGGPFDDLISNLFPGLAQGGKP